MSDRAAIPIRLGSPQAALARALGIDPEETKTGSLAFGPAGDGFLVIWEGMKYVKREEIQAAIAASDVPTPTIR